MVHARNVKPPFAGAKLVSVDESSVRNLPGFVKVVSKGNYVAVVCEREEQSIAAARQLKCNWQKPATAPFPASADLFTYMRGATPKSSQTPNTVGNVDAAFSSAAKIVEAEYEIPFQGHTSISPAHALADPSNGQMTIYSNDMKSYGMRNGVATFLGMPREQVRVIWMEGPQGYGRTAADDAGFEAAYLAKEIGRPVRMQWTRAEETGVGHEGPCVHVQDPRRARRAGQHDRARLRRAVMRLQPPRIQRARHGAHRAADGAAAGNAGRTAAPHSRTTCTRLPNRRTLLEVVGLPLIWETPIRTGNLRDPNGPQSTFAAESFIDEMAAAAKADPIEFRMRMLTASNADDNGFRRARSIAVLKAAAEKYGWQPRPAPNAARRNGDILTGRGIAYTYRNQTVVAEIAEVEVNRKTGRVWVKRLVCAHDCGLIINPEGLRRTIEGGMLHSISRALYEEVAFDNEKVLSVDWASHPSLTHLDTPAQIDVVHGQRRSESESARSSALRRGRNVV